MTPADKARALLASLPDGPLSRLVYSQEVPDEPFGVHKEHGPGRIALVEPECARYAQLFAAAPDLRAHLAAALDREEQLRSTLVAVRGVGASDV